MRVRIAPPVEKLCAIQAHRWESGIVLLLLARHPVGADLLPFVLQLFPQSSSSSVVPPPPPAAIATNDYVTLAKYPAL